MKQKLITIVGPTASGKSEYAIKLAKKINGEIISADSRQVYRGLNIGTGKVPGQWIKNKFTYKKIPHYCLDFVSPKKTFTVAEYKKCAEIAIKDIASRQKTPILVGGTGFWVDTVVYGLNLPEVPPNPKLRQILERKTTGELLQILKKSDPRRAKTIEQKNLRRLVRAIEIAKALGKVPVLKKQENYDVTWIGLNPGTKLLKTKIERRIAEMMKKGLLRETKKLLKRGVSRKRIEELGFEYKTALNFLDEKISRKEARQKLIRETLHYVRRQITWFKRNKKIKWQRT